MKTDFGGADSARLFTPFLDPIDGVMVVSANATSAEIESLLTGTRWRFPLVLDRDASLAEQVAASTHASASCRYGPFCDNILGMNWRLPSGPIVRIGERVGKSTTGYDLFRFLLHTGNRFGEAADYVLRLRPQAECIRRVRLEGADEALWGGVRALLRSSWMHWLDAVDFVADAKRAQIRVAVQCATSEWEMFASHFASVAKSANLHLFSDPDPGDAADGCPDLVLKTTPERLPALVHQVTHEGFSCRALCYNGVVHVQVPPASNSAGRIQQLVERHAGLLEEIGGGWHSRHLPARSSNAAEAEWIAELQRAFSPR
jgi:FAD/FMN-containing dehydrogenase